MSLSDKREELHHKAFLIMFKILIIFGIPAFASFFVGRWIDVTHDMRPYGSLIAIIAAMIISWSVVIRLYLNLTKEYKALDKLEELQEKEANTEKTNT